MRIRDARAADVKAMHALRLRVAENRLSDPRRVDEGSYLPFLGGNSAWVADTERGLAGFAILDLAEARVWALFVAPEAEGTGIGRALHARLLEGAAEQCIARLFLSTAPRTRAERFYGKAGWRRTGLTKDGEVSFERDIAGRPVIREGEQG